MSSRTWTMTARWIFPVSAPPLAGGTVSIDGERIVAVEAHGQRPADVDLGEVAVLPGLVNAHTHLDLTGLRGRCAPTADFTGWLRQVIAHRRSSTPEQIQADIRAGLAESLRHGTTLLGDISGDGASWDVLKDAPLRAVVFREILGLTRERANQALAAARVWMETHSATTTCRPAVSAHAPYSTRADLMGRAKILAEKHNAPVAIHLAETAAEIELMRSLRGPFVDFLKEMGVWDASGLARTPAQVIRSATWQLKIPQLFIHGNYLAGNVAIRPRDTIVFCPRTHAAFGHTPHPFRSFLARGVRVALGTDSLASNPDLSVLAEVRHLHKLCPDVPGEVLLRMATLSGAEALGWADETGSLEAGKSADVIVVSLAPGENSDSYQRLLDSESPVQRVLCRGQWMAS